MTTHLCFTGPRKISYAQGIKIEKRLTMTGKSEVWHVGDALGVDSVVRRAKNLPWYKPELIVYRAEGNKPWQLAARSKRMVDECYKAGKEESMLIAFPDKPCPRGVKPGRNFNGKGSGTWGTIAYAYHLGLEIELHWLEPGLSEPDWMRTEQLTLW